MTDLNKYQAALAAFVSREAKNYSARNVEKANVTIARLSDARCVELLEAANVDANVFNADLYLSNYMQRFVRYTFSLDVRSDFYEVTDAAFRTAMLCYKNNEDLRKSDIEASIRSDVAYDEERAHLIFRKRALISEKRQSDAAMNLLVKLNIAKLKSANVYEVNKNAIADAMIAALKLDMTVAADEEIDALDSVDEIEAIEQTAI